MKFRGIQELEATMSPCVLPPHFSTRLCSASALARPSPLLVPYLLTALSSHLYTKNPLP